MIAITREVSSSIAACELTHLTREPIDLARARAQHRTYERQLEELGCTLHRLPEAPALADSVFVEDCAVVLDELAIITRPGAASRRDETSAVEEALARYRPVARIQAPATLDGGDVLRMRRKIFVGRSSRTSRAAVDQLRALVRPHGHSVIAVAISGCLHLKSAVTAVNDETVLMNPSWIDKAELAGFDVIEVDPTEPYAANVLRLGDQVLQDAAFPRTAERLRARGVQVRPIDLSELRKAEGAVTCCSLILR